MTLRKMIRMRSKRQMMTNQQNYDSKKDLNVKHKMLINDLSKS